jgi:hypothetical protein
MGIGIAVLQGNRIRTIAAVVVLAIAACGLLAFSFGLERTLLRWELGLWKEGPTDSGRYQAYQILLESALPATGPFGSGPGSFEPVFETHRAALRSPIAGRWDKAHSDLLQIPLEWGWAGAAAWAVILIGGMARAAWTGLGRASAESKILPVACAFSLGGVLLHGAVDFPLQIASIQLFALVISGLAWGTSHHRS